MASTESDNAHYTHPPGVEIHKDINIWQFSDQRSLINETLAGTPIVIENRSICVRLSNVRRLIIILLLTGVSFVRRRVICLNILYAIRIPIQCILTYNATRKRNKKTLSFDLISYSTSYNNTSLWVVAVVSLESIYHIYTYVAYGFPC